MVPHCWARRTPEGGDGGRRGGMEEGVVAPASPLNCTYKSSGGQLALSGQLLDRIYMHTRQTAIIRVSRDDRFSNVIDH